MRIQVIGPGCAKCRELVKRTESAARRLDEGLVVEKVTDMAEMMKFAIMSTPALAIDGVVRVVGRVPTEAEITAFLAENRVPKASAS
jgi:small redox-active disulfide protein 2